MTLAWKVIRWLVFFWVFILSVSTAQYLTFKPNTGFLQLKQQAVQSGWYLQAVYQFMPRWRIAARTEQLDPGSPDYGLNAASFAADGFRPSKNTLMLDFNPSEFSRVRLQVARDRSRAGVTDNQLFLQYQMSLGAHGAHSY